MKTHKKKNNSYQKYRFMFFNFGLIVALLMTITAFEWETETNDLVLSIPEEIDSTFVLPPITRVDPPKPEEPKTKPKEPTPDPKIKEVKKPDPKPKKVLQNNKKKKEEIESIEQNVPDEIIKEPDPELMPDIKAEPAIGFDAFYHQIKQRVSECVGRREHILMSGNRIRIVVSFIVEKDGTVTNIEMAKGFTSKVNNCALEAVSSSGKWSAAFLEGRRVRQLYNLPIMIIPKN